MYMHDKSSNNIKLGTSIVNKIKKLKSKQDIKLNIILYYTKNASGIKENVGTIAK